MIAIFSQKILYFFVNTFSNHRFTLHTSNRYSTFFNKTPKNSNSNEPVFRSYSHSTGTGFELDLILNELQILLILLKFDLLICIDM
mgnify:CR=1 FL=1